MNKRFKRGLIEANDKAIVILYLVKHNPPASRVELIIVHIFLHEKLKNYSIQSFKEFLFFVFC